MLDKIVKGVCFAAFSCIVLGFVFVEWKISSVPLAHRQTISGAEKNPKSSSPEIASPKSPDDRIADYTWWVAAFTFALVVVSAFQGFFLIRVDKTARISAEAAKKSADLAESSLTKMQRAFVFVKEIDVLEDRDQMTGLPHQYRISAILENSGQTPAVRMIYNFNCGHVSAANIPTFNFVDQSRLANRGVLGPKATLQTPSKRISPAAVDQIKMGVDRWFIWGWVDFDDVFENTRSHRMEFCFEVTVRPLASGKIFLGFPMHDRYNATDDDCLRKPAPFTA